MLTSTVRPEFDIAQVHFLLVHFQDLGVTADFDGCFWLGRLIKRKDCTNDEQQSRRRRVKSSARVDFFFLCLKDFLVDLLHTHGYTSNWN